MAREGCLAKDSALCSMDGVFPSSISASPVPDASSRALICPWESLGRSRSVLGVSTFDVHTLVEELWCVQRPCGQGCESSGLSPWPRQGPACS